MILEQSEVEEVVKPDVASLMEQRMHEILDPSNPSALLVIDMQEDFVGNEGKAVKLGHNIAPMQAIIPKIKKVQDMFYALGKPVVRTRTFEDVERRNVAGRDRALFLEKVVGPGDEEYGVFCLPGTKGAQLAMASRAEDIIIDKTRGSAVTSELEAYVKENGIKTIYVTGVKTQRCVRATVNDLYDKLNVHVVVLEDCIATDDDDQQRINIQEMRRFYPPVITSDRLAQEWESAIEQNTAS